MPKLSSDIYAVGIIAIEALTGIEPEQLSVDANQEIVWRHQATVSDRLANIITNAVMSAHSIRCRPCEDLTFIAGGNNWVFAPGSQVKTRCSYGHTPKRQQFGM